MPRFCLVNPRVKYSDFFAHIYGYIIWYIKTYIYAKMKVFSFFCVILLRSLLFLYNFAAFYGICLPFFILLVVVFLLRNDKHN